MRARTTTAELVATILRPVRSTMAGIAAQMGVALEQDAQDGEAAQGAPAAPPPIGSAAGCDEATSAAGDDGDEERVHHEGIDPRPGLPPAAPARLGSPGALSRPVLRVGRSNIASSVASPEESPVQSAAADMAAGTVSTPGEPAVERVVRLAGAPRGASSSARPVWKMRPMRSRPSAGASAPVDAENAPSPAFHADLGAPGRGKRALAPEPHADAIVASSHAAPAGDAPHASHAAPAGDAPRASHAAPAGDAPRASHAAPAGDALRVSHAAPLESADSTVPPGQPLRLFFDRSAAPTADVQSPPPSTQPIPMGLRAAPGSGALPAPPQRAVASLAERVARGAAPLWDEAHRITSNALANGRASEPLTAAPPIHDEVPARDEGARSIMMAPHTSPDPGAPGAPADRPPAVSNTFHVNVHVDPERGDAPMDRDALEQALCEILRDAARRNGLEV